MNIFQIIALLITIACANTHLVFVYYEMERERKITKGLIVGMLFLFAFVSKVTNPLIYIGLIFSLAADILILFKKRNLFFIASASCFSVTHILNFILVWSLLPNTLSNWMYLTIALLAGYLLVEAFKPLAKPKIKKMSYPALSYLYIVFALFINIFILVTKNPNINTWLMLLGSMCFLASDNILTINKYVKPIWKANFLLMVLYAFGQILIFVPLILELNK